ncbi:MAG: DUF192 domain-containing protein [Terracidiphilus sp.]|jgi:uncharacterized membrane protein (UPF0127 family)
MPQSREAASGLRQAVNVTRKTILANELQLAGSGESRRKGLLGRESLRPGEGLWIVPCESVHTFFMRFAIDLVYLDRKHKVRKVRSSVGPWRMSACFTAHSVLELPAGTIRETQTECGDVIEIAPAEAAADDQARESQPNSPADPLERLAPRLAGKNAAASDERPTADPSLRSPGDLRSG